MMKLSDQLFKRNLNEAEKEFTFTEFLNLVDSNTGMYRLPDHLAEMLRDWPAFTCREIQTGTP